MANRTDYGALRRALGVPQIKIAAEAGVSEATLRLFERDAEFVRSPFKRAAIERAYVQLGIIKPTGGT